MFTPLIWVGVSFASAAGLVGLASIVDKIMNVESAEDERIRTLSRSGGKRCTRRRKKLAN